MFGGIARLSRRLCLAAMLLSAALAAPLAAQAQVAVRQAQGAGPYDAVTLELEGPALDEARGVNPFADYRLDVTFSDGRASYTVPGYFQGCADAADRACTGGRLWRAHFLPSHGGAWSYSVRFRTGTDIAANGGEGAPVARLDGSQGQFTVAAQARNAIRARGLLHYTGESYYRWAGDNSIFFKFGPDAPENMMAYADFDATPNYRNLRKTWAPHARDYKPEAAAYTWGGGQKGRNMAGMFQYLHDSGLNTISLLLFNVGGDDRNVIPQLLRVTPEAYAAMEPRAQWDSGVVRDRYDVSKLAQWQRALAYGDELGIHLHFKLTEQENDDFMDAGLLGRERKIYLREMIARFNHFLAVTWNIGEENAQDPAVVADITRFIASLDTYKHPLVLHTFPTQHERYRPLLGDKSALNGLSMQGLFSDFRDVRGDVIRWRRESEATGRRWVIGYDEQGGAQGGAPVDADYPVAQLPEPVSVQIPQDLMRRAALWNVLLAGSNGLEAYYGYQTGCSDLTCQDHRTRAALWRDGSKARRFFEQHVGAAALKMDVRDELTGNPNDYVFAELGQFYLIHVKTDLPANGSVPQENRVMGDAPPRLSLYGQTGRYSVSWFDTLRGGDLQKTAITEVQGGQQVDLGRPPAGGSTEWVVLVKRLP